MTVGEKIRRYRILKNMTQKELGEAVLKNKKNADVRINQYERNMAAPKDEIRTQLAEALDVDIDALSDVNITSDEDIMYVLFELEEYKGLQLYKEDGKIHLVFDDSSNSNNNELLTTYLNFWQIEFSKRRESDEELEEYLRWKGRFKSRIANYIEEKKIAINNTYESKKNQAKKTIPYAKETPEIVWLLRKIIDAGFTLSTKYRTQGNSGYSFLVNELLNPPSEEAAALFAQFLSELDHFNEMGAGCESIISLAEDSLVITYYIPVPALDIIKGQIDKYIEYKKLGKNISDVMSDNFEMEFESNLKTYHNNLQEEIELRAAINGKK